MKVVAIVQARMSSSRMPNKVMKPINGVPMIELLLARLSRSKHVNQIILATTSESCDLPLAQHVSKIGFTVVRGSENDVLDRYLVAARQSAAEIIVRITGDCPLVDPFLVDLAINEFYRAGVDYLSNVDNPTYPDGLDVEVFSINALERAEAETQLPFDREHVTPYFRRFGLFKTGELLNDINLSELRWTVDELCDFDVVEKVYKHFFPEIHFSWKEVLSLSYSNPEIFTPNDKLKRNEGALMSKGQKLWKRAKTIIPGGNMLLSKRPEMFLPEKWPAYYSKAKGCEVWDLEGNKYIDMSLMGVGTNILGYGHKEVDNEVFSVIQNGNMSTLNCPEEVLLAEKLIELHPWADMVRLARSGGEANAIAIRIARAATGKDKVAVCGYHGWHDWYLSANLGDSESLSGHLLPGLDPNGVPNILRGTVYPFKYNNFDELENLVNLHDIGVIKMEVVRNLGPENAFLHKVRQLASDRGIVLIFDECTSGFRQTFGGIHKLYGVEPDMAIFGKALGNGYAITATIGRREIMQAAQETFISSTFWTERIGPAAALKTLDVMKANNSWDAITKTGLQIRSGWQNLADNYGLKIEHWGIPALTGFTFKSINALAYKTLITQEMLASGYLSANSVYVSIAHTREVIERYFYYLDPVFSLIKECEEGRDVMSLLKTPICHGFFKRLN